MAEGGGQNARISGAADEPRSLESHSLRPRDHRRIALWFFVLCNCFFVLTSSGRVRVSDEVLTLFQAQSLVSRGETAIPQARQANLFYGKFDRIGRPQAPYPPGHALAAAPWYVVGTLLAGDERAESHDLVVGCVLCFASATFAAFAATLIFLILGQLGLEAGSALYFAGALALATPLWAYSAWFYSEPLTTALWLAALYFLLRSRANEGDGLAASSLAGLCLAAATWIRPTNILAAGVFAVAWMAGATRLNTSGELVTVRYRRWRGALLMGAIAGLAGAAYLWRNWYLFGNAWDFGYPAAAEGGKRLNTFETPMGTGLFGLLFSPGKSVFLYCPPLLLSLWWMREWWRRGERALAVVCSGLPLVYLLFYARYTQWEGGYSYGPRYLVPSIVVASVAAVAAIGTKPGRRAFTIAIAAGVFVQLCGLAVSFLEAEVNHGYYSHTYDYRMGYFALGEHLRLAMHYLFSSAPAPPGLGFDRWFLLLGKVHAPQEFIWAIVAIAVFGAALAVSRLRVELNGSET